MLKVRSLSHHLKSFCALALWLRKSEVQSYLFRIARKIFAEHFRTSLCSTQHYHPTTLVSVACNFRQIYTRYWNSTSPFHAVNSSTHDFAAEDSALTTCTRSITPLVVHSRWCTSKCAHQRRYFPHNLFVTFKPVCQLVAYFISSLWFKLHLYKLVIFNAQQRPFPLDSLWSTLKGLHELCFGNTFRRFLWKFAPNGGAY